MNSRAALRIARRELSGGLGAFRVFVACLALGVAAIAAVGSVRTSIEAGLEREGATLLGGDAEMQFTYRFASDEERAWMAENATAISEIADFRSMAVIDGPYGEERGLTQIKAIDDAYPLNPNGSVLNIAGISNVAGNVLGLMPHPEDHIFGWQHPRWHRGEQGMLGLWLFKNGVAYASRG